MSIASTTSQRPNPPKRLAANDGDASVAFPPKKRERYARVACDTCKARKVKCSGNVPCGRCSELQVNCVYTNYISRKEGKYEILYPRKLFFIVLQFAFKSNIPHRDGSAQTEEQKLEISIETMQQSLNSISSQISMLFDYVKTPSDRPRDPSTQSIQGDGGYRNTRRPSGSKDDFIQRQSARSQTSHCHILNVVSSNLEAKGVIAKPTHNFAIEVSELPNNSAVPLGELTRVARTILAIGYEGAQQLLQTFVVEVYYMYPCVYLDSLKAKIDTLFGRVVATTNIAVSDTEAVKVDLIDIDIIKAVLGIALSCQEQDKTPLGNDLHSHILWSTENLMRGDAAEVEDIMMASLMAIYFIQHSQTIKAWRLAGFAARSCLEYGLHKDSVLANPELKRVDDKFLSLTGPHPFLAAMVKMSRITSDVISLVDAPLQESQDFDGQADYLAFCAERIVECIVEVDQMSDTALSVPKYQRPMKALCQIRANHIRMLTHIKRFSASQFSKPGPPPTGLLASIAKDSVTIIDDIFKTCEIPRLCRAGFDEFLIEILSCVLLVVSHNPIEYWLSFKEIFHTAMELLRHTSQGVRDMDKEARNMLDIVHKITEQLRSSLGKTSAVGGGIINSTEGGDIQQDLCELEISSLDYSMFPESFPESFPSIEGIGLWDSEIR
ncbi:hypothetical protein LTR84_011945 [Exophiala bonariae]|uniref:Zn(2)-C6 fungal-type domain-containing protein n=1 Tax=Exophiala bonariae TaxID=1690606 RepID=A0AAV9MRG6_9EURO|nr:hypothetical protein LTR84_011945 [Exophiala bonariae]